MDECSTLRFGHGQMTSSPLDKSFNKVTSYEITKALTYGKSNLIFSPSTPPLYTSDEELASPGSFNDNTKEDDDEDSILSSSSSVCSDTLTVDLTSSSDARCSEAQAVSLRPAGKVRVVSLPKAFDLTTDLQSTNRSPSRPEQRYSGFRAIDTYHEQPPAGHHIRNNSIPLLVAASQLHCSYPTDRDAAEHDESIEERPALPLRRKMRAFPSSFNIKVFAKRNSRNLSNESHRASTPLL